MTSGHDRLEHAVTDDDVAASVRGARGRYPSLCGHLVTPRALVSPPGRRCPHCQAHLDQRKGTPPRRRAAGWMRWPVALLAALRSAE